MISETKEFAHIKSEQQQNSSEKQIPDHLQIKYQSFLITFTTNHLFFLLRKLFCRTDVFFSSYYVCSLAD